MAAPGDPRVAAPAAGFAPTGSASPLPLDDPHLEVYLQQIADLPPHDRAIIVRVLQGILAEEAAYERRVLNE